MAKLLLVEDNEMNRDMLSRRLERKCYQVLVAVDGEKGVELAKSEKPDLVFIDMARRCLMAGARLRNWY